MSLLSNREPAATLVLPVYNAAGLLVSTLRSVHMWLAAREEPWELIIVDDSSTDGSSEIVAGFVAAHPAEAIRHVRFTLNRGKGLAIRTGLGLARAPYVFFTDCDLAYPLENILRIRMALDAGAEAAIACRVLPESTYLISPSFFSYLYTRHVMGRLFNLLCRVLTVPRLLDTQAGLKGFRAAAVKPFLGRLVKDGFSFDVELLRALMDRRARIVEVPVSFRYDSEPSTVRFIVDSLEMFRDLIWIRVRSLAGCYREDDAARGAPNLIVHADDFGLSPGVNQAIQEGLESGDLTSASIMMGAPCSAEASAWAAAHPQMDIGVHLNLTQGKPVLSREQVRSLVTREGRFRGLTAFLVRFFTGRIRTREILAEWRAQIRLARGGGVVVSHLDSHQHLHLLPVVTSRVTAVLAKEERLAVRVMNGPVRQAGWAPDIKGWLLRAATWVALRRALRDAVGARGTGTSLMGRPTLRTLKRLVAGMRPAHDYELVVHPGRVDYELVSSGDKLIEGREREMTFLRSEEYRALLRHARIHLIGQRPAALAGADLPAGNREELPVPAAASWPVSAGPSAPSPPPEGTPR